MEKKVPSLQIKPFLLPLLVIILSILTTLILSILSIGPLSTLDTVLSWFPPRAEFKKVCEELNGKKYSWKEVDRLEGYCVGYFDEGKFGVPRCKEVDSSSFVIHSTADVEGTWACNIEKENGIMKTEMVYIHL